MRDGANNLANAPSSNGNGDSPAISEAKESGSMQSFLQTLRRTFGSRFLCYLVLNYMFLKGMVFTMLQTSMLPYFQKMGVKGVEFQLASVVAMIPWSMKGFIGVLSDIVPIAKARRVPYNTYVQRERQKKYYERHKTHARFKRLRRYEEKQAPAAPLLERLLTEGADAVDADYEQRLELSYGSKTSEPEEGRKTRKRKRQRHVELEKPAEAPPVPRQEAAKKRSSSQKGQQATRFQREQRAYEEAQAAKAAARQQQEEEKRERKRKRKQFAKDRAIAGKLRSKRNVKGQPSMQSMLELITSKLGVASSSKTRLPQNATREQRKRPDESILDGIWDLGRGNHPLSACAESCLRPWSILEGRFHKRGYLLLSAMLGGFGVCVLGLWRPGEGHLWTAAALFGCAFTFLATFDLLCEGKYSEMMREEKAGSEVLTFVWTMCQWGSLLAAAVLYFVIDSEGPRPVILGCLPFAFVAFWRTWMGDLHEEPARSWKSLRAKAYSEPELFLLALLMACGSLVVALATAFWGRQGRLLAAVSVSVLLVVFSFRTLPRVLARSNLYMFIISISYLDLSGPLSYWYTGTDGCVPSGPHFSYSYFLAVSNVVGSAGSMLGAVLFQSMQSWSFRSAFRVTTFVQISASLFDLFIITRMNLTLGIPDAFAYLFGDAACQSIAAQMIIMPQALLTARLCPRGAEATVFAILAGFQNFGSNIGSILGAQLAETYGIQCSRLGPCNFESLINLIILCHILAPMACLSFLFLVPTAKMNDEKAFATDSPPPSFASPSPSPLNSPRVSDPDSPEPEGDGEYFLLQDDGMVVRQLSGCLQTAPSNSRGTTLPRWNNLVAVKLLSSMFTRLGHESLAQALAGRMEKLSWDLLEKARSRGGRWLVEQADKGRLVGELLPLRRLAWIRMLGVVTGDSLERWPEELDVHRKQYNQLLEDFRKETDVKAVDPKLCNPLSRNADNPYLKIQVNEELLKEIWKDVERTFPECEFLSSAESRKVLQRILFHWCRSKNPSLTASDSYRQGMNELAAVLYSVTKQGEYSRGSDPEALGARLCGSQHNEADAFACFVHLMNKGIRPMFLAPSNSRPNRSPIGDLPRSRMAADPGAPGSAILARCQYIFEQVVRAVDSELFDHLKRMDIEAQVFLLRWIRLLFCREFELKETYILWDGLLASAGQPLPSLRYTGKDPVTAEAAEASGELPLLDFAAAALLLRMRRELIGMDQTECLRRLLRSCSEEGAVDLLAEAKRIYQGKFQAARPREAPSVPAAVPSPVGPVMPSPAAAASPAGAPGDPLAEDPLRRGQQFLSVAAQGAQGLLQAGRTAYAKLSDQERPAAVNRSPAGGLTQSIANWVDIDLWSDKASTGSGTDDIVELRRRAQAAEQERDDIKRKANEFFTKKKQEFAAQLAERDQQIQELSEKLAKAEQALAQFQAGEKVPQAEAVETVETVETEAEATANLQVLNEMANDI
ncbi:unnamed protein product [Effrenium voratum]|nr:unnamed protein product [Effrenium voratum]